MQFNYQPLIKLEKALYGSAIKKAGQEIFDRGKIIDISLNERSKTLEFKVNGNQSNPFSIKIKYINSSSFKSFGCSCTSISFCEHIAAVIKLMLDAAVKDIDVEDYLFIDELYDEIESWEPIILQSNNPNEFRLIPAEPYIDENYLLSQLKPSRIPHDYQYIQDFNSELRKDNTLEVTALIRPWNLHNKEKLQVELKFSNERISIKCNTCTKKIDKLCPHAYVTLELLLYNLPFQQLWTNYLDYEMVTQHYAEQSNTPVAIVRNHYTLHIGDNFYFEKSTETLKESKQLKSLSTNILKSFHAKKVNEENYLGAKNLVDTHTNAIWWPLEDDEFPELLIGKLNKAKDKIISGIKLTNESFYFNPVQRDFYKNLRSIINESEEVPLSVTSEKILQHLKDNVDILNSISNFAGHDYEVRGTSYGTLKKSALRPIEFSQSEVQVAFELSDDLEGLLKLSFQITLGNEAITNQDIEVLSPFFLLTKKGKAHLYQDIEQQNLLEQFEASSYFSFAAKDIGTILPMLSQLKTKYPVKISTQQELQQKILYGGKKELFFSELGQFIIVKPYINFEGKYKQNALTRRLDDQVEEILFDIKGDDASKFVEELTSLHETFSDAHSFTDFFHISIADFLRDNWFFDFFEKCKRLDIAVFGTDVLSNFKFNKNKPAISAIISSGIDWFGSTVDISFGKLKVPLNSWVEMVKNNQKYIKLSDGTLGLMPEEWIDKLKALYNAGFQEDGEIKVSKYNFSIIDEYFEELSDEAAFEEIKKKKKAFENYTSIKKYRLPRSIKAELRDYQMEGYRWLRFLDEYELGGCLADDMGLGKTLQMLCLLAYKKERKACFALVIVPNSLIFNWSNEIEKFCPSLKYLIHHGPNRGVKKIDKKKYDIIITTYGTAASDVEDLREIEFETIILDESQAIKNPNSKRYKAVKLLKALHRYVMTGTPIENNTFDLFAQINFVNPGLLGNANSFRGKFAVPIDSKGDEEQSSLLRKIIHPFLLRRTKEQVAEDLPEKTESIIVCEMAAKQRKYYDSVRNDIRNGLNKSIEDEGLGRAKFMMLEGLLRLRQICNSPQLVDKSARADSVKIDTLIEHIMSNNSHKALVFSQFVGMLGLIKERLDEMQIRYAYLDGSTKNRQEQVEKFQSDRKCQVFLISIKAGNTGLNLTAADYVYIVDPWWNPAVEAQAIDRTHRIGQVNNVFAYRMVCKDTIEEKILLLQEKKKAVAADIIQSDESILKSLKKDDLLGLFE